MPDAGKGSHGMVARVTVCRSPPERVIYRDDKGLYWCFGCRARLRHELVWYSPIGTSWYGPRCALQCERCGKDRTRMDGERRFVEVEC